MSRMGSMAVRAGGTTSRRAAPVSPVRTDWLTLPAVLLVLVILTFAFVMMGLEVRRDQLSDMTRHQQLRVEQLRGEVARLSADLARETSLNSVRQRALAAGMVDPAPEQQPRPLVVVLRASELERVQADGSAAELGLRPNGGEER